MNWTVPVAFCVINDLLKTLGHKDDPQRKTPARVVYWPPSSSPGLCQSAGSLSPPAAASAADCTACPTGYRCCCPELSSVEHCVLDTLPRPVCENVRAPRRLAPGLTYRGYIPSKRACFHGLKLHLVCNNHPFITEVLCTPGSVAAVQGLYLLPLDLAQGSALYVDRGTRQRTTWRWPGASRKGNSRRYHQPNQFIATLGRRIIESVGSALTELFPLWDSCHHPPGLCAQGVGLHLCPQLQAAGQRFVGSNLG